MYHMGLDETDSTLLRFIVFYAFNCPLKTEKNPHFCWRHIKTLRSEIITCYIVIFLRCTVYKLYFNLERFIIVFLKINIFGGFVIIL